MKTYHVPVMLAEVLENLNLKLGGRYIDCNLGGGGHTKEILRRGGKVLGIDVDPEAIAEVRSESWPVVRDPDELHDALLTLMVLPPVPEWIVTTESPASYIFGRETTSEVMAMIITGASAGFTLR